MKLFDIVIKNGFIADGTGAPLKQANVAVKDGRIVEISGDDMDAARVIDAKDMVVSPGFIDIHSHTDAGVLVEPTCQSKVTQGVTTEVSGNCGSSSAPVIDEGSKAELAAWLNKHDIHDTWSSMGEFLGVLERNKFAVNFATYVGHGNIRAGVVGLDDREPTPEEMQKMRKLTAEAMESGAFGLTTGLIYAPSCFAKTPELVELAKIARDRGGIYASHIRSEEDGLIEAVDEAIEVGRQAEIPVQISHHKACATNNWGKVKETLAMIDEARTTGLDVTCDQYPYIASATGLSIMIPQWAHDGGGAKLLERLKSDERLRITRELKEAGEPGGWVANGGGWKTVVVSGVSSESGNRSTFW